MSGPRNRHWGSGAKGARSAGDDRRGIGRLIAELVGRRAGSLGEYHRDTSGPHNSRGGPNEQGYVPTSKRLRAFLSRFWA